MKERIEIYQLITMLDDFFENPSEQVFDIGEMVGCNLIRYAAEAAAHIYSFNSILFVSGYQDAIYANTKPNHIFWGNLFCDFLVDDVHNRNNPFEPTFKYTKLEYEQRVVTNMFKLYNVIIINQAHLIPQKYLDMIRESFSGKIVRIFDPFDCIGENYDVPLICVDSFEKLPYTIGYARSLYGIDTRFINKRAKNSISTGSIKKRSIGKLDDNQYVTSDGELFSEIQDRQMSVPFRKNQKVIITDRAMNNRRESSYEHMHSLTEGTLLHISQAYDYCIKCRIHLSHAEFDLKLVYSFDPFRTPTNAVTVMPANIMLPSRVNQHFFKQIIYVTTNNRPEISIREQYTLIKQSQNLIIAKTK